MFKNIIRIVMISTLTFGSLSAFDLYLMGKGECKTLKSYGLKGDFEGYQQFTNQYGCKLLEKNDNIGYFKNQCSGLKNQIYFVFINYNNCLNMSKISTESSSNTKNKTNTTNTTLGYKDFYLGMDKNNIPSQIKLVQKSKMRDYDKSYMYVDGNNNLIEIDGIKFEVSFVIRGDNNKVRTITYTAKNVTKVKDYHLKSMAMKLTNMSLKKRTMNNYKNGKLANIILENSVIKNGIEEDFRIIFGNENAITSKNEILIMHSLTEKKKSESENNKMINKTVNNMFVTIKNSAYLCTYKDSLKKLIDIANKISYSKVPYDCIQTKRGKFAKTYIEDFYRGNKIIQLKGAANKFYWTSSFYIE